MWKDSAETGIKNMYLNKSDLRISMVAEEDEARKIGLSPYQDNMSSSPGGPVGQSIGIRECDGMESGWNQAGFSVALSNKAIDMIPPGSFLPAEREDYPINRTQEKDVQCWTSLAVRRLSSSSEMLVRYMCPHYEGHLGKDRWSREAEVQMLSEGISDGKTILTVVFECDTLAIEKKN